MDVIEELEAFRAGMPGCEVAALVDLSTSMVLSTSTNARLPQEELDALATAARDVLTGPMSDAALGADGADAPEAVEAMLATRSDTRAFIRGAEGRHEALICVCGPDADLAQVFDEGRRTLATLIADD